MLPRNLSSPAKTIQFGPFEVDSKSQELRNNGTRIRLPRQSFQVLEMLLNHPGELVTREELGASLWPSGTFVDFEHGLNATVKRLRNALGDSADTPRWIETLPRRGYRFIGTVADAHDQKLKTAQGLSAKDFISVERFPSSRRGRKFWLGLGFATAILLVSSLLWRAGRLANPASSLKIESLAVLPLDNISGDPSQDYFADGMTDELITELGQIKTLHVISRTSVLRYKGTHKPLPQIARELNVGAILEGTVMRSGEQVRVTAQLIQAPSEKTLWAHSYQRELLDVLSLQNEIAGAVAKQVRTSLSPAEQMLTKIRRPINLAAYEAYWKGDYFLDRLTPESVLKAVDYFQEAIAKDPDHIAAYNQLAASYQILGNLGVLPKNESQSKAHLAIEQALARDPLSGAAHAHKGWAALLSDLDFATAGAEFKQAVELSPNGVEGHQGLGEYYAAIGDLDQAVVEAERARELDPLSLIVNLNVCKMLYFARRFDEALAHCKANLELDPEQRSLWRIGAIYAARGEEAEATSVFVRAFERSESSPAELAAVKKGAQEFGLRGMWKASLQFIEADHEREDAFGIALAYTYAGNKDRALTSLDRAYEERSFGIAWLAVDPAYDSLRSDPRFAALLRRMRFPQNG
jgi:TolB-like protein/DNA-binding winged helix-turn-helix (wHTH) protein/Tfp pilus assembly protein PilF